MARKKKSTKDEANEEIKTTEEVDVSENPETEAAPEVAPIEYPKSIEPEDPFLLKWNGKKLGSSETSYIRNTLATWIYAHKGIDKRPGKLSQEDFEAAMQDSSFARKISHWL